MNKNDNNTGSGTSEAGTENSNLPESESGVSEKSPSEPRSEKPCFPIVGIGASAGGLEALETFFVNIPGDSGIAFVVIQHLSPNHKSIMGSLLSKYTSMKILEIEDGMNAEPDTVYINPPNRNVSLFKGTFCLTEPVKTDRINLPIDSFFRSLAEDTEEKAVCIIFSGTASDGTLGLKAVKEKGGMVMVQSPESARYDGMPRSAISTGLADYILPVEKIPAELIRYLNHPYIERTGKAEPGDDLFQAHAKKIFSLIRAGTGHDFSNYKHNTIRRRVERRMAVHQIERIRDYVRYLGQTPAEVEILFRDLLIGVTNFFRDPEAFEILRHDVIPHIIKDKTQDAFVRVWVVGCATGEEAYSLAMLFAEGMEEMKTHLNIQIFASDINTEAIDFARASIYPASITADITEERVNRFFIKTDENHYQIKKQIREMIVFSVQNLIKDPPFSKIDLISCRNLLIYMNAALQKKVLPLFHYALNSGGYLFLGTSESIGEFTELFSAAHTKSKIFACREKLYNTDAPRYRDTPFFESFSDKAENERIKRPNITDVHALAEKAVLEAYAPPAVLINKKYEIIHFIGETDRYLRNPVGKASFNIMNMAREGLQYKLNKAIRSAFRRKRRVREGPVRVKYDDTFRIIDVEVSPLTESLFARQEFMLIVFKDNTPDESVRKKDISGEDPAVSDLRQELFSAKAHLQTTIEDLETSNEELKSANEELQSVNEELQSTNEELETSKEELQSTNEELVTVNTELQKKVDELSEMNNDINNLLASTEVGTIFLDSKLCIKRFTPTMTNIFNLIQSDVGRPINHITSNIPEWDFHKEARAVLDTLIYRESEIQNKNGNWYSMRIAPYRTVENVIDGVVITFVDVNNVKAAQEETRKVRADLEKQVADLKAELAEFKIRTPFCAMPDC